MGDPGKAPGMVPSKVIPQDSRLLDIFDKNVVFRFICYLRIPNVVLFFTLSTKTVERKYFPISKKTE